MRKPLWIIQAKRDRNSFLVCWYDFFLDRWLSIREKIVSLQQLWSLVRGWWRCFELRNLQNLNTYKAQKQLIRWAALLCVCEYLQMLEVHMVGSSFFFPIVSVISIKQHIAKKKFLVFGRVLPIERLCSTHFRKHHNIFFPYCAIIILAYLYIISLSYLYLMQLLYLCNYIFWSLHILQLSCLYNLLL